MTFRIFIFKLYLSSIGSGITFLSFSLFQTHRILPERNLIERCLESLSHSACYLIIVPLMALSVSRNSESNTSGTFSLHLPDQHVVQGLGSLLRRNWTTWTENLSCNGSLLKVLSHPRFIGGCLWNRGSSVLSFFTLAVELELLLDSLLNSSTQHECVIGTTLVSLEECPTDDSDLSLLPHYG